MKTSSAILAVGVAGAIALFGVPNARANFEVSASLQIHARADFDAPLATYGTWASVGSFGRCWHPARIAADWRPYCEGEWVWTDAGWYWDSDEPWAWACYHYGTWVDDPTFGWIWVPDVEWAPAWVDWRFGGGFIGWAPCAPRGVVIAPEWFAFVDVDHFHDRIRPAVLVRQNDAIIRQTREFREEHRENRTIDGRTQRVVVNEGPGAAAIEKATGRHLDPPRPIADVARKTSAPAALRNPNTPANTSPSRERENFLPRPDTTTKPETMRPEVTPTPARPPVEEQPRQFTPRAEPPLRPSVTEPPRENIPRQETPVRPAVTEPPRAPIPFSAPTPVPREVTPRPPAFEAPHTPVPGIPGPQRTPTVVEPSRRPVEATHPPAVQRPAEQPAQPQAPPVEQKKEEKKEH